jgi:hypothetical protein
MENLVSDVPAGDGKNDDLFCSAVSLSLIGTVGTLLLAVYFQYFTQHFDLYMSLHLDLAMHLKL